MTLIGCICAWNEQALIGGAIDSLWALGCERVVVVDGAWEYFAPDQPWYSTDDTRQVAIDHGAEIVQAPGRLWYDEAEGRSAYLVGNDGDWYLIIDADERISGTLPGDAPSPAIAGPQGYRIATSTIMPRVVQHRGRMAYYHTHWTVYSNDRLIDLRSTTALQVEHVARNDPERDALRAAFYPDRRKREQVNFVDGHPPRVVNVDKYLPVRYIGNGAWIPGVPASDMTPAEHAYYAEAIAANLTSVRPIYELVTPPAETPDKPTKRRKTREE